MYECKLGEQLVRLRLAKGVTQDEVAQNLSISNKTISKWETGISLPDLPLLVALSEYFGVTTDRLLGLSDEKVSDTTDMVCSALEELAWKDAVLKAFVVERAIIPAIFHAATDRKNGRDASEGIYPAEYPQARRSQISTNDLFQFTASAEDINLSVTLLRNKSGFAWLGDPAKQQKIVDFFRFLSGENALSVLYFIHSADCARAFTADYISANTGVPIDRVTAILKEFCRVGECRSLPAHLAEGDVDVYECFGDGIMLSVISLAYERMCGKPAYDYCFNSECRMIGGK